MVQSYLMKKKRPRTEQRVRERDARRLVRDREKLAALSEGGSPERAFEVTSSSVIPVRARAQKCPQCGGTQLLDEETAESAILRATHMTCQLCGTKRVYWFKITSPLPS
jgi:hypothetical protein